MPIEPYRDTKIFIYRNKNDLENREGEVIDADVEDFCEQYCSLTSAKCKASYKTSQSIDDMFNDMSSKQLEANPCISH
uniref:Uncharacterized protein n=1 Tax=Glossina austeni TaxID=7395 RepID=A0A1A9VA69_GLOAU